MLSKPPTIQRSKEPNTHDIIRCGWTVKVLIQEKNSKKR